MTVIVWWLNYTISLSADIIFTIFINGFVFRKSKVSATVLKKYWLRIEMVYINKEIINKNVHSK